MLLLHMFRYISFKIKYSLKCVLSLTFERENMCRWPKLSGFSGTEVNQTSNTIRCGCLYMRDHFGKVCVMHFRADMINHHKLRTTTVFVEQNPSLSCWIINDLRAGKDHMFQTGLGQTIFEASLPISPVHILHYYSGVKQKCFLSLRLKDPLV